MMPYIEDIEEINCVICGSPLHRNWRWTDFHGEGICCTCGAPYDMKGYRGTERTQCRVKSDWIPILKEYWEKFHKYVPLGAFFSHSAADVILIKEYNKWVDEAYPEKVAELQTKEPNESQ